MYGKVGVIWIYLLFHFKTDRKLKILIHDSVGVKMLKSMLLGVALSGFEELFDSF